MTTFAGIPVAQEQGAFQLWETVLNAHPEIRSIVELGTYHGGFSAFLAAQAHYRGMRFTTFDVVSPGRDIPWFSQVNIFDSPEWVHLACEPRPTLLYCDNGSKPTEVQLFAPTLLTGDILAVHDWGTEIYPEHIPEGFHPLHTDECEELDPMTRFFSAS